MHQQPDFQSFAAKIHYLSEGERSEIKEAFDFAVRAHEGQKREDGSPYVFHVIAVAQTVAEWHADQDTIIGALLHDTIEDTGARREEIAAQFGRHVALLVESVTKFTQADLSPDLPLDRKIETLRKIFDVMQIDLRCIIIKLADRLHNIQTIGALPTPERRKRVAQETLNVYHKIALHMGMRNVRHIYAEFSVPHAFNDGEQVKQQRNALLVGAESLGEMIVEALKGKGDRLALSVELQPRNLLTFYERQQERGASIPMDAFIVSINVATDDDCYAMLRLLHQLFRPISGQFHDFIAAPSEAGYQSLHTVVAFPNGGAAEIRIRTPEMEKQSQQGLARWLFSGQNIPPNFSWLQRTKKLDIVTRNSSKAFWEALQADVLSETMVITIDHHRLSLPKGATILDAAYALYNEKAECLATASVGGRQEPLATTLRQDDDVHLTISTESHLTFDWLQMVSTQHARLQITEILKKRDRSERIRLGALILQKEFDHYGKGPVAELSRSQRAQIARYFRRDSFDDVLAMIGEGVIRTRDIVFFLEPEHEKRSLFSPVAKQRYNFRLRVCGTERSGQDILALLHGVIRLADVTVTQTTIQSAQPGAVHIIISGSAENRLQYADFVEMLERQEWTTHISTLIERRQKVFLIASAIASLCIVVLNIALFPAYHPYLQQWTFLPQIALQSIPLLPILAVNYYLLRLLRHYIVRMRSERWFLGMGLLLNVVGLVVLIARIITFSTAEVRLLPLIALFTASLLYMGFRFFQTDQWFNPITGLPVDTSVHRYHTKRERIIGYSIRIAGVILWGLVPVYIRSTGIEIIPPMLRLSLMGIGVLVPFSAIYLFRWILVRKFYPLTLPLTSAFWILSLGQMLYAYLENTSLIYTTGTNLLLFNNFSPVIGLFIAVLFWRHDFAYLRQAKTMLWIFILAVIASFGSALLLYTSTLAESGTHRVFGDILALLSAFVDVAITLGQVQYMRQFKKTDGIVMNLHIFLAFLVFTAPFLFIGHTLGLVTLPVLPTNVLLLGMGSGTIFGIGLLLNCEAFKRIDGLLAYILFNLSVVVTFAFENYLWPSSHASILLLFSGILIVGASIGAEIISMRAERKVAA